MDDRRWWRSSVVTPPRRVHKSSVPRSNIYNACDTARGVIQTVHWAPSLPPMHPESADAAAPTRLPSIVMSFPSPSPSCHACPLFLHFAAPREKTHTYTRARTVHVHARDARRAKRRAKESAPRRPELSRSHGSSSGSGGDIPTYLPIGPVVLEPACRKRLSVSFFHLSLSFSLYLSHSRYLRLFLLLSYLLLSPHADTPHSNPREGTAAAGVYTTRADRMHYRDNDKQRSKCKAYCENRFHLIFFLIWWRNDIFGRVGKKRAFEYLI